MARICGRDEAVRITKIFLFGERSDGQWPFAGAARPHRHNDGAIATRQTWLADHYVAANPVAEMAAISGLPPRTLNRRFRAATGFAPMEYVQTLRAWEAKQLLETTSNPVDEIAEQVVYCDPTKFRRLFRRRVGTTPSKYRRRFATIGQLK